MQKRYFIGPQIVDKETFYNRASAAGLFPKFNTAKYIYRRVWEFGTTPDGEHFQRAFLDGVGHPGELFMAVRIKKDGECRRKTREELKQESLTKIWCGMCNYFTSISEDGICGECPFKDEPSMCYDDEECDYEKFEEFIKGLKIT